MRKNGRKYIKDKKNGRFYGDFRDLNGKCEALKSKAPEARSIEFIPIGINPHRSAPHGVGGWAFLLSRDTGVYYLTVVSGGRRVTLRMANPRRRTNCESLECSG